MYMLSNRVQSLEGGDSREEVKAQGTENKREGDLSETLALMLKYD